jgi:hypothetical protein
MMQRTRLGRGISARVAVCASLAIGALAVGAAGCGSTSVTVTSQRRNAPAAPIERLLLFADMKSEAFTATMYRGFTAGLANRLRLCSVRSRAMHRDPLDVDADSHLSATLQAFRPTAAMRVKAIGGQLNKTNGTLTSATLYFDLELIEAVSGAVLWHARSALVYSGALYPEWERGVRLATGVVAQLRDDGMLPRCAVAGPDWPAVDPCDEQRRRVSEEGPVHPNEMESRGLAPEPMCQPEYRP